MLTWLISMGSPRDACNEQVRRNKGRFPEDFMFQLTEEEHEALRSQITISKGRGGAPTVPDERFSGRSLPGFLRKNGNVLSNENQFSK